jgi:hypothetical protein
MTDVESGQPSARFVYGFSGTGCGVPLRVGHWWIQTVPEAHALMTLDVSNPEHPREVGRLAFDAEQKPHWISLDSSGHRIVLNSGEYGDHRIFMLDFNPQTGELRRDERFRDTGSDRPGVSMDGKTWPHGFHGNAYAHGTVFSR